jgi:hypothetical protein
MHGVRYRDLICTPCGGNYGTVVWWAVVLNGSPAKGTLFLGENRYREDNDVFYVYGGRSKRLGVKQAEIARRFQDAYLSPNGSLIENALTTSIVGVPVPVQQRTK